jgi:hypothetical protein
VEYQNPLVIHWHYLFGLVGNYVHPDGESHFGKPRSFSMKWDVNALQSEVFHCTENPFFHTIFLQSHLSWPSIPTAC